MPVLVCIICSKRAVLTWYSSCCDARPAGISGGLSLVLLDDAGT